MVIGDMIQFEQKRIKDQKKELEEQRKEIEELLNGWESINRTNHDNRGYNHTCDKSDIFLKIMETIELISMVIGGLTLVGVVILAVYSIFYEWFTNTRLDHDSLLHNDYIIDTTMKD